MKLVRPFPRFDAILNTDACGPLDNAELTLKVRLGFRQINPNQGSAQGTYNDYGAANGTPRKIVRWSTPDWLAWKSRFVSSAQRFWHGKFWLVNQAGLWPYRVGRQIFIPNIWCRFELVGNDAAVGNHHHVIDVVRLDSSESWFGSHATLYDDKDTLAVRKGTDHRGRPIMQRAHVHEVGHLLGLAHVDVGKPHCPANGDTNAVACYGIADPDKRSVMGEGMRLREANASPWVTAMALLAQNGAPSPLYTAPLAVRNLPFTGKMKRHYPRTVKEFEERKMLTTMPTRMS